MAFLGDLSQLMPFLGVFISQLMHFFGIELAGMRLMRGKILRVESYAK